jgi:uncharacterized membrane protein YkgB
MVMFSYETRAVGLAIAGVICWGILLGFVEMVLGIPSGWGNLLTLVVVVGFGFGLPQLYLIRVDDTVPTTYRLGFLVVVVLFFGIGALESASPPEERVILALIGAFVLGIFLQQIYTGYQSVIGDGVTEGPE